MRNLILGLMLAMSPLAITSGMFVPSAYAEAATGALGDLSSMHAIVADTLTIAKMGDMTGAEKRITDFETAWDQAEPKLRPLDTATWTSIDHVADTAIEALRGGNPSADAVVPALDNLLAALGNTAPVTPAAAAAPAAFSLKNADGSPVPCEVALAEVRRVSETTAPPAAAKAQFDELMTKGIERCNADDDKRADGFFGQALDLLKQ